MKASTLITLAVALFLAIGTALGARALGLFSPVSQAAPPPPVVKILVARTNLYEGMAISANQVVVRELRSDEAEFYNKNRDKFLAASPEAAALRTPTRNIEADAPILKTDLEELTFPKSVRDRLRGPHVRAVNVTVPKERAAGGLITRDDYVDVYLTSVVADPQNPSRTTTLGAVIARNLKVIVKRNSLWTVLKATPDNVPIAFTLEANLYRAALIEYAQTKGNISLLPAARVKDEGITPASADATKSFSIPDSREYRDEDKRVDQMLKGEYSITEADLERIYNLQPIVRRPPPPPPIAIQNISGNQIRGASVFTADGKPIADKDAANAFADSRATPASSGPAVGGGATPLGYTFQCPGGAPGSSEKTTDKKT